MKIFSVGIVIESDDMVLDQDYIAAETREQALAIRWPEGHENKLVPDGEFSVWHESELDCYAPETPGIVSFSPTQMRNAGMRYCDEHLCEACERAANGMDEYSVCQECCLCPECYDEEYYGESPCNWCHGD